MKRKYSVNYLSMIIDQINAYQCKFNDEFKALSSNNINFKSRGIQECMGYTHFLPLTSEYVEFLNSRFIKSEEYLEGVFKFDLDSRIKLKASLYNKLRQYASREDVQGKTPMIKCLNDLMGFRVILTELNLDELKTLLEKKKKEGVVYRYYHRDDGLYTGIHCYFKIDNQCFPWELQIWDIKWKESNLKDHVRHEQEKLYNKREERMGGVKYD